MNVQGLSKGVRISVILFMVGNILFALSIASATTGQKTIVYYEEGVFEEEYKTELHLQKFDDVQAMGGLAVIIASKDLFYELEEKNMTWGETKTEGFIYGAGGFAMGEFQVTIPETGWYVIAFGTWGSSPYYIRIFRETPTGIVLDPRSPAFLSIGSVLALVSIALMVCGVISFAVSSRRKVIA